MTPERAKLDRLVDRLRLAAVDPGLGKRSDAELIQRFRRDGDAAALEQLIRRHGRVVLLACRRQLRAPQDVEDCFQAVWLIFARKASTIRRPDMLASWLYGVARRTAIQARASAARRRAREKHVARPEAVPPDTRAELWEALEREIERLPTSYRAAVLLCDVEGCDYRVAARRLGWPEGTLAGRLARARQLLARRLARQGITLSAAVVLAQSVVEQAVAVAPALAAKTAVAAALFRGAPGGFGGLVSAQGIQWAQEALRIMHMTKLKIAAALLLAVTAVAGLSGGLLPLFGGAGPGGAARVDDDPAQNIVQVDNGDQPAPDAVRASRPEDGLATLVSVDFDKVPLRDALEQLRRQSGVKWVVDWQELETQDVPADLPITLRLDKAPLRTVLRQIQRAAHVGYFVEDGVLVLSSDQAANDKMLRRVYPVADLVPADSKGENLIEVIVKVTGTDGWVWSGGVGGLGGLGAPGAPGGPIGSGAAVYFAEGRCLVVVQSMRGHEEIAELLAELRAARPGQKLK